MNPGTLNSIGTGLGVFGSLWSGLGDIAGGKAAKAAAEYEAAQLRQQGGQAQAASQREAITAQQQAQLVASRALAVAAASGGGASDPTVVKMVADIAGEGAYRQALALYQGDAKARDLNAQADAAIYGGELAQSNATRSAVGKFVGAAGVATQGIARGQSLRDKYGGAGPSDPGYTTNTVYGNNPWGPVGY